ncbi:MAG: hypothetical protein CSA20_07925 [Deltaproteobacteria bacterium]|nr:MAG: hypothetical protein CSB23_04380 [Deltaproteobacteria bacterium]PIE72462.1 MAG: hypothetical protein CSA20_07925 [Deltaproteobacteria bacterium]
MHMPRSDLQKHQKNENTMKPEQEIIPEQQEELEEGEKIEQDFTRMEALYRSRCIQAPVGMNVQVREIEKDGQE